MIADMTIPTLVNGYKKQVIVTKLKKTFAELNQVVMLSEIDNGPISQWDFGALYNAQANADFTDTYIAPYMNVIKRCDASHSESGCWKSVSYTLAGTVNEYGDKEPVCAKILLASGTALSIQTGGNYVTIGVNFEPLKPKAMFGKDIFFFNINSGKLNMQGQGAKREDYFSASNTWSGCTPKVTGRGSGMGCAALIQLDGWRIADDYPW